MLRSIEPTTVPTILQLRRFAVPYLVLLDRALYTQPSPVRNLRSSLLKLLEESLFAFGRQLLPPLLHFFKSVTERIDVKRGRVVVGHRVRTLLPQNCFRVDLFLSHSCLCERALVARRLQQHFLPLLLVCPLKRLVQRLTQDIVDLYVLCLVHVEHAPIVRLQPVLLHLRPFRIAL